METITYSPIARFLALIFFLSLFLCALLGVGHAYVIAALAFEVMAETYAFLRQLYRVTAVETAATSARKAAQ